MINAQTLLDVRFPIAAGFVAAGERIETVEAALAAEEDKLLAREAFIREREHRAESDALLLLQLGEARRLVGAEAPHDIRPEARRLVQSLKRKEAVLAQGLAEMQARLDVLDADNAAGRERIEALRAELARLRVRPGRA